MIINYTSDLSNELVRLATQMHRESRFNIFKMDGKRITDLVKQPNAFCVLSKKDDHYTGFFIGVVSPQWFGPELAAYDLALYVEPEHRGGFTSISMIRQFEAWAKQKQCSTINVGSSAEIATDITKKLYNRLGYRECGFVAHKEI